MTGSQNPGLKDYQFGYRTSIEHFRPQRPEKDIDPGLVYLDDDDALDHFGNLALVTVSANSKFSNKTPASKAKEHPESRRQSPKLDEMCRQLEESTSEWSDAQIRSHGMAMRELLDRDLTDTGTH